MLDLDILAIAKAIYEAVMNGQWALVAALALMLVVYFLRKFVAPKVPFLASDAGGAALVLATAIFGAFAAALSAGEALSLALVLKALQVGFAAAGGWAILKKALLPLGRWLLPLGRWLLSKLGLA